MKLSIIVPVYNLEKQIYNTIESLLNIAFNFSYEILVINDGSTDNSKQIISCLKKDSNIIRVIDIEHRGVSYARNVGITEASGDYIAFVDGDDTVNSDFFQNAINELDKGSYDFVQLNYYTILDGKQYMYQSVCEDITINSHEMMLNYFFGDNKLIHNAVWGKVFRTSLLKEVLFDIDLRISEDQKFIFDLLNKSNEIKLLKNYGYNYFIRPNSIIHSFDVQKHFDAIKVLDYCFSMVSTDSIKKRIKILRLKKLLSIYDNATINRLECTPIYEMIKQKENDQLLYEVGNKTKIKLLLLHKNRFLYDKIIKIRSSNRKHFN